MTWISGDYAKRPEYHLKRKKLWEDRIKKRHGPDYLNDKRKRWRLNNPEKYLLANARRNSKERNLEFNLTLEDIIIPETCPILGTSICINLGGFKDNSPSVDRFDNTKGYVKNNINVISWRANSLKS